MKQGTWKNTKSGLIRSGQWTYYWPSDVFHVWIKGIRHQKVRGDYPEFRNWKLVRHTPLT